MSKKEVKVKGNIYGAGVYCFVVEEDDEVLYIGSSLEMNDALSRHLFHLKKNNYYDTNKRALQLAYDREDLTFCVLNFAADSEYIRNCSKKDKAEMQNYIGILEEFCIDYYEETVCNLQKYVTKHSSNKNKVTSYKRRMSNIAENNPNCKYSEDIIANILWLKINGYKPKEIAKIMAKIGVDIKNNYISQIGTVKWIFTEPRLTISADILNEVRAN